MRKTTACLTLLLAALALPSFAQKTTATIRGTVTDASGSVVPGANVTAKSEGAGFTRPAVTNSSGVYTFAELPVGTYTVEVSLSGFKSSVVKGVTLNVADVRAVDVQLTAGGGTGNRTGDGAAPAGQNPRRRGAGLVT